MKTTFDLICDFVPQALMTFEWLGFRMTAAMVTWAVCIFYQLLWCPFATLKTPSRNLSQKENQPRLCSYFL